MKAVQVTLGEPPEDQLKMIEAPKEPVPAPEPSSWFDSRQRIPMDLHAWRGECGLWIIALCDIDFPKEKMDEARKEVQYHMERLNMALTVIARPGPEASTNSARPDEADMRCLLSPGDWDENHLEGSESKPKEGE